MLDSGNTPDFIRKHAIKFPTEKFALALSFALLLRRNHGRSACETVFLTKSGVWWLLVECSLDASKADYK